MMHTAVLTKVVGKVHATIPKEKVTWDMINSFNRREANFLLYLQTYTYGVS